MTFAADDSEIFSVFFIAEKLGQTVTELLTGAKKPLSNHEFTYWLAYFNKKSKMEEEANKPKKKDGQATQEFKKTMGNRQTAL